MDTRVIIFMLSWLAWPTRIRGVVTFDTMAPEMKGGLPKILLLILTTLALAGCASGTSGATPAGDLSTDTNTIEGDWRPHVSQDTQPWPGFEAAVAQADGPLLSPDLPATGGKVDLDGDGHCAKGTSDPMGKCKTFDDCDDKDPKRHPWATETCNDVGVDNDCDGDAAEVDLDKDGKNDLGVACQSGLDGVCAAGSRRCDSGKLVCKATVSPGQQKEVCNGLDDDCDKTVDNGTLCAQGNTCQGAKGCGCGSAGACVTPSFCCGGACQNLDVSTSNCGACGVACGPNETCHNTACRCGPDLGKPGAVAVGTKGTCTSSGCQTCNPTQNLAASAAATFSGGSTSSSYGAYRLNDGQLQSSCTFCWVKTGSSPAGAWVEYQWSSPQLVGRVWFDTTPTPGGACTASSGRSLGGGKIQYWNGSSYVTVKTVSGKNDDWDATFSQVSTTRLRLYDLHATSTTGQKSNPVIFEWRVFCQ